MSAIGSESYVGTHKTCMAYACFPGIAYVSLSPVCLIFTIGLRPMKVKTVIVTMIQYMLPWDALLYAPQTPRNAVVEPLTGSASVML